MSLSFLTSSNNLNLYAATLTLSGLTQSQNTTPPLIITSAQSVPIANLYAARAAVADNFSGNISANATIVGFLSTTANILVGTYLEVGTDAYIGDDLIVGGFAQIAANASVGTDLQVGNDIMAGGNVSAYQLESTAPTGVPPLIVSSTTEVANLNSEFSGTADVALALKTATGSVVVSGATHPTNGQILSYNGATGVWVDATSPTGNVNLNNAVINDIDANVINVDDLTVLGTFSANITSLLDLTGPITATNGVTAVAAQTGTGSTFVMAISPTLTTPVIGAATGTSLDVSGALQGATVTADATTNQIVLGTTNTTTISSSAPSASRVITIHDAGAASNMVLDTGGAMTITNSATTGYVLTATSSTASTWQSASSMGTFLSTSVTLTDSDIRGMFATPITLVAAPGAGKVIVVHSALFDYTYGGTAFTGAGSGSTPQTYSCYDGYTTRFISQFQCPELKQARGYFLVAIANNSIWGGGVTNTNTIADITNKAIVLSNNTAAYTSGNGSMKVTIEYSVITL